MNVNVKLHNGATITKNDTGDWYDLSITEDVELRTGEFKLLSLGVSMQIPKGYEALVIPRSSTYKKYGILQANSVGLIDNSYSGDNDIWMFPALSTRHVRLKKGTRLCQFRFVKNQEPCDFVPVESLETPDRGGFGSTCD